MYIPFRQNHSQEPFLSPLGKRRRPFPAIAAPLAVTAIGGIALVVAAGALFSGMANRTGAASAPSILAEEEASPFTPIAELEKPSPAVETPAAQDEASTAAIPAAAAPAEPDLPALSFNAPVAADDDGIAMLEVIPDIPLEDEPQPAATTDDQAEEVAAAQPSPGQAPATVKSAVNLRAAPRSGSEVLSVVPAKAQIEAQRDCNWCAVTYDGRKGFIYKSFIDYR